MFLQAEAEFYKNIGLFVVFFKCVPENEQTNLKLRIFFDEAISSSKIEGEILERESVRSSICKEFGVEYKNTAYSSKERGIGKLMWYNFSNFAEELSEKTLQQMNGLLWDMDRKPFRTSSMNIVSGRVDDPHIHFQAPPADRIEVEMKQFCRWFNHSN